MTGKTLTSIDFKPLNLWDNRSQRPDSDCIFQSNLMPSLHVWAVWIKKSEWRVTVTRLLVKFTKWNLTTEFSAYWDGNIVTADSEQQWQGQRTGPEPSGLEFFSMQEDGIHIDWQEWENKVTGSDKQVLVNLLGTKTMLCGFLLYN